MSIVYDALTKTQKNIENRRHIFSQNNQTRNFNWFNALLLSIIFGLTILALVAYYPKLSHILPNPFANQSKKKGITAPTNQLIASQAARLPTVDSPLSEIMYQGSLQLSGVFISEQEKIAVINGQSIHIGDIVDGKKIISIDYEKVRLQDKNRIFVIKTKI